MLRFLPLLRRRSTSSQAAGLRRAAVLVGAVVLVPSLGIVGSAGASERPALGSSPADNCLQWSAGPASKALKTAVCNDFVADLAGIGKLLGLPILAPTSTVETDPVKVTFATGGGGASEEMVTEYFAALETGPAHGFLPKPCGLTIFPIAWNGESPVGSGVSPKMHVLLAHEAVHCYQKSIWTQEEATATAPWVSEASATYLATLYAGYGEVGTPSFWDNGKADGWIANTEKNLTLRSYDAVGWYSLVSQVNADPLWSKFAAAWRTYAKSGASAYIAALGGNTPAVEQAWAPSVLNTPAWGDVWSTPGIGVPPGAQPGKEIGLRSGDKIKTFSVASLAALVDAESDISGDIVTISVDHGYASIHDADGRNYLDFTNEVFCLKKSCGDVVRCTATGEPIKLHALTQPFDVAVGGSPDATQYEITSTDGPKTPGQPVVLPSNVGKCAPDVLPPTATPTGSAPPAAYSEGDPHLLGLNGQSFDFQGVGEYTLVRSHSGAVQIQAREQPAVGSDVVSWNTGVAMRVVSSTVEVDPGTPPVVLVGGKAVPLANGAVRSLPGGGSLSATSDGDVLALWPDGSRADVFADARGENVTFTPPPAGIDHFSGLLTALVPNAPAKVAPSASTLTLLGGDGHRYVLDPTTVAGFRTLYQTVAPTWKVTTKTSLFTYPAGKHVGSYDVKGFPARLATTGTLTPADRQAAATKCKAAGVTDPKLLADCELDVGVTGQPDLATAAAKVQTLALAALSKPTTVASSHPASFYFSHPCAVVTAAEIKSATGQSLPMNLGGAGVCLIGASPIDVITFSSRSAATATGLLNLGSKVAEPSVGHDAVCATAPAFISDQAYLVATLGAAGSLEIVAGSCDQSVALAKSAFSHIST